jgi:hypothetical protein
MEGNSAGEIRGGKGREGCRKTWRREGTTKQINLGVRKKGRTSC